MRRPANQHWASMHLPSGALIVLEQPCWRRASCRDEVLPPPGLLRSLHAVAPSAAHQRVALILVVGVEAVMGAGGRPGLVQLAAVCSSPEDKVHAARSVHVRGQAHSLWGLGVARSRGAHYVGTRSEQAPVVSTFSWPREETIMTPNHEEEKERLVLRLMRYFNAGQRSWVDDQFEISLDDDRQMNDLQDISTISFFF